MTTQQQMIAVDDDRSSKPEAQPDEAHKSFDSVDAAAPARPAVAANTATSDADLGTSYLPDQTSTQASERWQHIQSEFVDDPRKTVAEAHQLVSELMQRIVDTFAQQRAELERQWTEGDSVSTEDLRICLQRYRAFFSRLLPSVDGLKAHAESA
jgi:sarcosine oxidase delta subunit